MSVNDVIDETQLPAWMKQARRGVDWGALLIIGFCLIAGWSFIVQDDLPATNDSESYVYRSADYADAFEEGIFYTRWSPHAVNGYGAPIPHYYPSGAVYAGGLISYLFTNNPVIAVRIVYVLALVLAGSMTYTFVTQRTTALAGMMAGLLYVFSPYVMVTVNHIEGDLPLAIGTALLPSLLWAVNRLLKRYQALDFMLIAVIVAYTIFTVPIILLQGIIAVLVLLTVEFQDEPDWHRLAVLSGAILSGVLLSAFYWLPALMQYQAISWHMPLLDTPPDHLIFSNLFVILRPIDPGISNQVPIYTLGAGLLFALLINLCLMPFVKIERWFSLSYLITGIVILSLIVLFIPDKTSWMVLVTFCFAVAGSHIGQQRNLSRIQSVAVQGIILFAVFIVAPVWRVPAPNYPIEDVSSSAQVEYEQSGSGYAGLPAGLPLPSNLLPEEALASPISQFYGDNVIRLSSSRTYAPLIEETPYTGRYTVSSPEATSLIYNRAYFDGWNAISSEGQLNVYEADNHLISIDIPENTRSDITIRLGSTSLTLTAWVISLIASGVCGVFWGYRWQHSEFDYDSSILLTRRTSRLFSVLLIALIIVGWIVPPLLPDLLAPDAQYSIGDQGLYVRSNFARSLQLLAYERPHDSYSGGETMELNTFWSVLRETDTQYLIQLRIMDNFQGNAIYESGYSHPGYFPTTRWHLSSVLAQSYEFKLPDNLSPGNYLLLFDIYGCAEPCSVDIMQTQEAEGQIHITLPIRVD